MRNFYKIKKACPSFRRGITLIEMLVVVAIIGIIILVVLPQFAKMRENQVLKSATADILSAIDKARSQTLASVDSSEYGLYFQSDKAVIFKGTAYFATDASNENIDIISPANISNVNLAGSSGTSGELYFNRLSGSPSKTGTIIISVPSNSKIIIISATGSASAN